MELKREVLAACDSPGMFHDGNRNTTTVLQLTVALLRRWLRAKALCHCASGTMPLIYPGPYSRSLVYGHRLRAAIIGASDLHSLIARVDDAPANADIDFCIAASQMYLLVPGPGSTWSMITHH